MAYAETDTTPLLADPAAEVPAPDARRHLGFASAYVLVMSRVIGTGIFATPGLVVKSAGSAGLSLVLWVAGALLSATDMVVWLEYGCMLPRSGGHKVYLEQTFPRPRFLAATLVAVQAVLLTFSAGNCEVFGEYVLFALGADATEGRRKAVAASLMVAVVLLHGCFHRTGLWLQDMLGWAKVAMVGFIALTGLGVVLAGGGNAGSPSWDNLWVGSDWSVAALSAAIFKVNYAYAGLNNANNVLNEVRDPVGTLRRVLPVALITACLLYLLVNVGYFLVVPLDEIKASGELVAALFFERVLGARIGAVVLPFVIALSAAGNVLVVTFGIGRLNQEVARAGFVPAASLVASTRPFGAPLGGLVLHALPSLAVILLSPSADVYSFILDVEGYPVQLILLAVAAGLLRLRKERPDLPRPFRAWLPAVWVRVAVCLVLLAAPFFPPADGQGDVSFWYATYAVVGMAIIALTIVYWYVWTVFLPRRNGYQLEEKEGELDDGTTIMTLVRVPVNTRGPVVDDA